MKKSIKIWIGVIIGTLFLAMLSGFFYGVDVTKAKNKEIKRLQTEVQTFKTISIGKNEVIVRQEQSITDLKTAVEAGLIDLKALKAKGVKDASLILDLQTENTRLKLEATYEKPPVIIHDTVYVNGNPVVSDYMKVPQPWKFDDQWTFIRGTVKTTGVTIDSLKTYNQPNITMGWSRGFLKKSSPIITWSDQNPYSVVKDMSNVVIINNPPFYKKTWFHILGGILIDEGVRYGIRRVANQK